MLHAAIVVTLLSVAVLLCFLCSLGVAVMRDPFQRLNFTGPVSGLSLLLITIALWMDDQDIHARLKTALIFIIIFAMNGALTHATGRAIRIRRIGQWLPKPEEKIPLYQDGHLNPPTEKNV